MVFKSNGDVWLKVSGLTICRCQYSRYNHPLHLSEAILRDPDHNLYLPTKRRYDERPKDTLWWSITSNTIKEKSVVRSWVARRMRRAFTEALERNGMDSDGRRKVDHDIHVKAEFTGLIGTLQILALPPVVTADVANVRSQMDSVVQLLVRQNPKRTIEAAERKGSTDNSRAK